MQGIRSIYAKLIFYTDMAIIQKLQPAINKQLNSLRVEDMLLLQYPCRQGFLRITVQHRHRILQNNRTVIHALIHKVDSAA